MHFLCSYGNFSCWCTWQIEIEQLQQFSEDSTRQGCQECTGLFLGPLSMLPLSCGNSCAFVLVVLFFGRWVNKRPLILFPPQNLLCVLCLACCSLKCKTSVSLRFLCIWKPKNGGGAASTSSAGTTGLFYPETHKMRLFPGKTMEHHCWLPKPLTTRHVLMKDEVINFQMRGGQCCKSNGGRTAGGGNGLLTGCYHSCAP